MPSLYEVRYKEDGTIKSFVKKLDDLPEKIKRQVVDDFSKSVYPSKPL